MDARDHAPDLAVVNKHKSVKDLLEGVLSIFLNFFRRVRLKQPTKRLKNGIVKSLPAALEGFDLREIFDDERLDSLEGLVEVAFVEKLVAIVPGHYGDYLQEQDLGSLQNLYTRKLWFLLE